MWNTNSNGTTVEESTIVKCNATETDVTGITGLALIEKLKKIARDNQIGKFDIFDFTGRSLSMADVIVSFSLKNAAAFFAIVNLFC